MTQRNTSVLRKEGRCFICGAVLPIGTEVEWYREPVSTRGRFDGREQPGYANRPVHVGRSEGCKAAKAHPKPKGSEL